jgi:hypothetical protein
MILVRTDHPFLRVGHHISQLFQALDQLFQAPIQNLQDALTWCHSTEFTGTRTILPDKTKPSTTSLPSDTNIHINSFFVVTQLIRYKISTLQIMYTSQYSAQSFRYVFATLIPNKFENVP